MTETNEVPFEHQNPEDLVPDFITLIGTAGDLIGVAVGQDELAAVASGGRYITEVDPAELVAALPNLIQGFDRAVTQTRRLATEALQRDLRLQTLIIDNINRLNNVFKLKAEADAIAAMRQSIIEEHLGIKDLVDERLGERITALNAQIFAAFGIENAMGGAASE